MKVNDTVPETGLLVMRLLDHMQRLKGLSQAKIILVPDLMGHISPQLPCSNKPSQVAFRILNIDVASLI